MADPASILGLISASLTITIRAATIGKDLHTLTTKFKSVNAKIRQLSVHVSAVRVAARSLSSWLEDDEIGSDEVEDVKRDLLDVLSACCDLLSDLQDHVAKALAGAESVGFKGAVTYVWDEEIIKEATDTLHHQETALILMLQTLGHLTRSEQRTKLRDHAVVQTLSNAKRPSSSIFGLNGDNRASARFSYASENSEKIDDVFTFDMEVMASAAYRNAFTSLLRSNIGKRRGASGSADGNRNSVVTITTLGDASREEKVSVVGVSTRYDTSASNKPALPSTPKPEGFTSTSSGAALGRFDFHLHNTTLQLPQTPDMPQPFRRRSRQITTKPRPIVDGQFMQALYDYNPDDKKELSFRANDLIQVITQLECGWWDGAINGVRGWFPSNYCMWVPKPDVLPGDLGDEEEFEDLDFEDSDSDDDKKIYVERWMEKSDPNSEDEAAYWIPQSTHDGRLFYFNTLTGVTTMDLP